MAQSTKSKTKQRRPVKKRPPLSATQTSSGKKQRIPTQKKSVKKRAIATKKNVAKKAVQANKKASRTKSPAKKKTTKRSEIQIISLPLGRRWKLVLAINHSKRVPIKRKPTSKKTAKANNKNLNTLRERVLASVFLLAGFMGIAFFGWQAIAPTLLAPVEYTSRAQKITSLPPPPKQVLQPSPPVKLRAPAIALDSALAPVGLTGDGAIEVPHYSKAGWYSMSPTPGEFGPSVIVGHLDNIHGTAVFWRLKELAPGQIVEIDRQDGKTAKFVIERINNYPQNKFPVSEVYGDISYAGLRLITCSGQFNHRTQRYSSNTVIYASLMPERPPNNISIMNLFDIDNPIGHI